MKGYFKVESLEEFKSDWKRGQDELEMLLKWDHLVNWFIWVADSDVPVYLTNVT